MRPFCELSVVETLFALPVVPRALVVAVLLSVCDPAGGRIFTVNVVVIVAPIGNVPVTTLVAAVPS